MKMNRFMAKTIFILVFICVAASSRISEETKLLRDPPCKPLWLLVELPVAHRKYNYRLSTTHALVQRCMGVYNEKKACMSIGKVKIEKGFVINDITGTDSKEIINVSWQYHEDCKYRKRICPIEEADICNAKSTTHYYDESNCTCACIVDIDDEAVKKAVEDICPVKTTMEFTLYSNNADNSTDSKKKNVTKNHDHKKCWNIPKFLTARPPKRLPKTMTKKCNRQPILDPIAHLIIEAGSSFFILRWHDPMACSSSLTIESFRINWMSRKEKIKTRIIEASKMENPERKMIIPDLQPDTEYALAIFIKVKNEGFFSRPTIRTVKTLSSNEDSMLFYLGDIGGNEL